MARRALAGLHFLRIEPVAQEAVLPLPGTTRPQIGRLGLGRRDVRDALAPETDVDAGAVAERAREGGIELAAGEAQLQQRIVGVGLDLRCQHAGGGAPALAHVTVRVEHQDAAASQRELPRRGRTYRSATHDDNIVVRSHLYFL